MVKKIIIWIWDRNIWWVTIISFGLHELNSIDYSISIITMILTNPDTVKPAIINLDVCNEHPDKYLINWQDVEDLVFTERNCCDTNDKLLELENG